jgi:hypothetical protein
MNDHGVGIYGHRRLEPSPAAGGERQRRRTVVVRRVLTGRVLPYLYQRIESIREQILVWQDEIDKYSDVAATITELPKKLQHHVMVSALVCAWG